MDLTALLHFVCQSGASDLHLSAGAPVMVRVEGAVRRIARFDGNTPLVLNERETRELVFSLLTEAQQRRLEADRELDVAIALDERTRFRGNVFYQRRGLGAVFRHIPSEILDMRRLGLPESVAGLTELEAGLVLVTGPTGSGKSTTLASMIDAVNGSRPGHIITIEDPIEFLHVPKRCMVNQRELGAHTLRFANALRSALREDPDVVLVGEMRDLETIELALTTAETGHLVFSTLHTMGAAQTVERIINVFPHDQQDQVRTLLAHALAAVISQVLLRKDGGGRVAAYEVLVANPAIKAMIRTGRTEQILSAIQTGKRDGMQTLEQSLDELLERRLIVRATADVALEALAAARGRPTGAGGGGRA